MADRRFKAPGQTALYQCLLTVICVYSLSMNDPKNEKEKKAHALILLPAPAQFRKSGHCNVTKNTDIFPLVWRCCH